TGSTQHSLVIQPFAPIGSIAPAVRALLEYASLRGFRVLRTKESMKHVLFALLLLISPATSVLAWNHFGHLTIAAIAYDHLTPKARTRIDALLQLNPSYSKWVAGIAAQDKRKVAFMRAATWPDLIKTDKTLHYINDGERPSGPDSARNIGYADKLMHRYWHYLDIPF